MHVQMLESSFQRHAVHNVAGAPSVHVSRWSQVHTHIHIGCESQELQLWQWQHVCEGVVLSLTSSTRQLNHLQALLGTQLIA